MHPADNPNTPPDKLAELLLVCPDVVCANPVFPLLFLENPGWLEAAVMYKDLEYLLNHPTLPRFLVEHLRNHSNAKVRAAAEAHIVLGLAELGWESEIAQRIEALPCPKADRPRLRSYGLILDWLSPLLPPVPTQNRSRSSRIATESDLPRWQRGEELMKDSSKRNAPLSWFCGLLVTENPKRLTDAARSDAWYTRFAAAIHPLTKTKSRERLANDGNRYVRAAAQSRLDDPSWRFAP